MRLCERASSVCLLINFFSFQFLEQQQKKAQNSSKPNGQQPKRKTNGQKIH